MGMERNTYAASAYIAAEPDTVFDYLAELRNLGEWTLNSVMREQVDASTWRGSATGFHDGLYYHVRTRAAGPVRVVEWHCGRRLGDYPQVYPVLILPGDYPTADVDRTAATNGTDGGAGRGTWVHWISCADPSRVTDSFMDPIKDIHDTELWGAKARLERASGLTEPWRTDTVLTSQTIYIDAPYADACAYLADPASVPAWSPLFRVDDTDRGSGDSSVLHGTDEYDRPVTLRSTTHDLGEWTLIEHNHHYTGCREISRTEVVSSGTGAPGTARAAGTTTGMQATSFNYPLLVIPASYAFGQPDARGVLVHRLFWFDTQPGQLGRPMPGVFGAECITIKRVLEERAGNLTALGTSLSYRPRPSAPRQEPAS